MNLKELDKGRNDPDSPFGCARNKRGAVQSVQSDDLDGALDLIEEAQFCPLLYFGRDSLGKNSGALLEKWEKIMEAGQAFGGAIVIRLGRLCEDWNRQFL